MKHNFTRAELIAFCTYLNHLLLNAEPLHHEVLYALVVKLYQRLLDVKRERYALTLSKTQAIAFCQRHYDDLSAVEPFIFATVQPLFEKLDAKYNIIHDYEHAA